MIRNYMGPALAEGQAAHTNKVKPGSNGDFEGILKNLEKQKNDLVKLALAEAKHSHIDDNKQNNTSAILSQMMGVGASVESAKLAAAASKAQQAAALMQKAATMSGQKVRVDNSVKSFSAERGERVKYEFELMAKNLPKNASINAQLIIKDKKGKTVRTENVRHLKPGHNEFNWDGKTSTGKLAEAGEYKIEIRASYHTPGTHGAKMPITVNTSTEEVIDQVNMDGSYVLENGRTISDEAQIVSMIRSSSTDRKKNNPVQSLNNPNALIGKTVTIKEDTLEFNGARMAVGFNAAEGNKNAKVKIIVRNKEGLAAMDVQEMNLHAGRNLFEWKGAATKTDSDLKAKEKGKDFPQVANGSYEYTIYIQDENGQWQKADATNKIHVASTEQDGFQTNIIDDDGNSFPISAVQSVAETKQTKDEVSLEELKKEARNYLHTRVQVADNVIRFDGSANWERAFPVTMPSEDAKHGPLRILIRDEDRNIAKTIQIDQAKVDEAIDATAIVFSEMTEASQAALNEWINDHDTINASEYSELEENSNDLDQVKYKMIAGARDGTYKYKTTPGIMANWDGKKDDGEEAVAGTYTFEASAHIVNSETDDVTDSFNHPKNAILAVTAARVTDDRELELTLQDGRIIDLGDVQAWVS